MATMNANAQIDRIKQNILSLFDRPTEPAFIPKGNRRTVFDIPSDFLPTRYKDLISELTSRFGEPNENRISIKNITLPDISVAQQLGRNQQFSLFIPRHRQMAGRLIDVFMDMRDLDDLQSAAVYCREQINPLLFNYALSVAILHRNDTRDVPLPNVFESFPGKFFDGSIFSKARQELGIVPDGSRTPIVIPRDFTGTDLDPEHRVAYFREDLGINLHHWHWHLVYPFTATNNRSIVEKDRRGELFYHMHHQFIARYNAERFCNNLPRVTPFTATNEPIPEGYFPKLESPIASRSWPPRFVNTRVSNVNRPNDGMMINLQDFITWRNEFQRACEQGFVVDTNNMQIPLTEERGIDILGNIIEASILTPNGNLYGDIHNMGHMAIAYAHDPDNRFLESFGIMGDSATAMRDPIFYRWHAYMDQLFELHKSRLPRYTTTRLGFPGVKVVSAQIDRQGITPNQLETFWEQSDLDLSRGMDFGGTGSVFVRFSHLQHEPFSFRIIAENSTQSQVFGTVRIFMAPKTDDKGAQLSFEEQRILMMELDKFRVGLRQGVNTIVRSSTESSVTIPYERTFRNLNAGRPATGAAGELQFNFCGCGWPQHMLIPKGTEQGVPMDLFVMISNYANDRVAQEPGGSCSEADSFCGIMNRRYPDRQSMGYPFDRIGREGVTNLSQFLTPNMVVQPITITHRNRTVVRANNRPITNLQTIANRRT